MYKNVMIFFIGILCIFFYSCKDDNEIIEIETRNFYMGFTPWPYDATQSAVDWTYSTIFSHGDIVSQHIEEGVPWQESYDSTAFSSNFMNEIQTRTIKNYENHSIVLSLNPLNMQRNSLAPYRGESEAMDLQSPWDTLQFNSSQVLIAYENYVKRMIQYVQPDYLIIGIEVNLLLRNNPKQWDAYVELHSYVYSKIKEIYPHLPVGVSVFSVPYCPEWSNEDNLQVQLDGLKDINPYIDFLAYSVHPFMSGLLAESFPDDYFKRLFSYTTKPIAISESSYPAQLWQTIKEPILTWNGTQDKQESFLYKMLEAAHQQNALFVIWFTVRDYDALWNGVMNQDPIGLIWRDTGLFDEQGNKRKSCNTWLKWLQKEYSSK